MKITIEGDEVVIRCPLNKDPKASSTGKTTTLAYAKEVTDDLVVVGGVLLPMTVQIQAYVYTDAIERGQARQRGEISTPTAVPVVQRRWKTRGAK